MKAGWQQKTLGEVLLKTETANPQASPDSEFDYVDVSSVSNQTFVIEETQRLKGKDAPSRARRLIIANDVIFATIRPTLRRIAIVPEYLDNQVCSTGYFVLRPKSGIDHRYLFYWLFSDDFMSQMEILQKGASYPAVTDAEVRSQLIPFPSLNEQQRIVAILDETFDCIALAKTKAETNLSNARAIFDSHLDNVFDQSDLAWKKRKLIDVCDDITVGFVGSMKKQYRDDGIPFLRSQNVRPFEVVFDNLVYIDSKFHTQISKSELHPGDLVIVRTGYAGTAAVIPDELSQSNCSDLVIIRPSSMISPHYLAAFFNSSHGKRLVSGEVVGAAQKHFNIGAAKNVSINVPPLVEQLLIVNKVANFKSNVEQLELIYKNKLAKLEALKESMLHQAFSGLLVAKAADQTLAEAAL